MSTFALNPSSAMAAAEVLTAIANGARTIAPVIGGISGMAALPAAMVGGLAALPFIKPKGFSGRNVNFETRSGRPVPIAFADATAVSNPMERAI